MTNVQIEAGTMTASVKERQVTGLLLPFGEVGRTNLGKFSVQPNAVLIPRDVSVVTANDTHKRDLPLGRAVSLTETPEGIVGTFSIANTEEGDELLAEIEEGKPGARNKLSAEVANVVIRDGVAVSGRLFGAAFCKQGAFPSAALVAADAGELADEIEYTAPEETVDVRTEIVEIDGVKYKKTYTSTMSRTVERVDGEDVNVQDNEDNGESNDVAEETPDTLVAGHQEGKNTMAKSTTTAPAGIPRSGSNREDGLKIESTGDLFAAVASANGSRDGQMFAALADITESAHAPNMAQPQYVGELWDGVGYERQYINLFNHAELTSYKVNGWKWGEKPKVASYAGNKTDVPSNTPTTLPVSIEAERIAGAHDIDRRYRDFSDTSFFESYYKAMTESYAEVSDITVLDNVVNALTPTALSGTAPSGTNAAIAAVVQGYYSVLRATRSRPTFALIADNLHEQLIYVKEQDRLSYLEQILGIPVDSTNFFIPSVDLPDDHVLVGVKGAVTVHELGGGAPIRVEALDVARGGVDAGVFGYLATNIHKASGLALIDTTTP